jgi:hypothetical protein
MRIKALLPSALVLGLVLIPAAGFSQTVASASGSGSQPSVATSLVIEQFLRAVNAKDLDVMGRLFGTKQGSIVKRDERRNVEARMFALATILKHEDYALENTEIVPGRRAEASRVMVRMTIKGQQIRVPYTLVLGPDKNWLIEQIDIEQITNPR